MSQPTKLSGAAWRRQVRRDWAEFATHWESWEPQLLSSLSAVDPVLVRELGLGPGRRVLDFGCGSGEPALAIAQLVAPRGSVIGLDVSGDMLETARRRARLRDVRNVRFRRGDVARVKLPGPRFDAVVSRYGLMFVDDVAATLARVRQMMKPGGRIALAVWGPLEGNPFFRLRASIVARYAKVPLPDPENSPHPLRLARPGLLPRLLREAGFARVRVQGVHSPFVFRNEQEIVDYSIGPGTRYDPVYRALSRAKQREFRERLQRAMRPFRSGAVIRVPEFAWVVSARR